MAKNTSYQNQLDGKSSGIIKTNPVNDTSKSYRQGSNTFDLDYDFYSTERYSDITPFYVSNAVPRDVCPLINAHELRTYTMQAPLMAEVYKHKNYFQVPMTAILPNTFDYFFKNPTQGDDVPDDVYCSWDLLKFMKDFLDKVATNYNSFTTEISSSNFFSWIDQFFRQILLLESFFSSGSLLNYLGFPAHPAFSSSHPNRTITDVDKFVDNVVSVVLSKLPPLVLSCGGRSYTLESRPAYNNTVRPSLVSPHKFLELIREDPSFSIGFDANLTVAEDWNIINTELIPLIKSGYSELVGSFMPSSASCYIDVSRLIAYQLCCAHFFTNDSVDFIYSADLYRKNALSFYIASLSTSTPPTASLDTFEYNGTYILYDVFSEHSFNKVITTNLTNMTSVLEHPFTANIRMAENAYCWFSLIFQFRHSLKYGDYFTGSKPRPLAIADINAPVVNNTVSAIDMTVSISKQRFANAVNRFGASVDDYLKGIFGTDLPPVDTDPKWLANESFLIYGTEVENTGSEQRDLNSVTTILKSNGNKYAFECYVDTPSIILGLSWYSIKRAYSSAIERFMFHRNRFDMFNPFMQYIGDQEIYAKEISLRNLSSSPFAYTGRHMEYKQRFNRAVGGFANNALVSWSPSTDVSEDINHLSSLTISPDFIRSSASEFDKYYSSLTGLSLGTYFHFIVRYANYNSISRAMDFTPSIL